MAYTIMTVILLVPMLLQTKTTFPINPAASCWLFSLVLLSRINKLTFSFCHFVLPTSIVTWNSERFCILFFLKYSIIKMPQVTVFKNYTFTGLMEATSFQMVSWNEENKPFLTSAHVFFFKSLSIVIDKTITLLHRNTQDTFALIFAAAFIRA